MDPRKSKWTGWIEVGQNTIQLIVGVIQLVTFMTATAGIIFAYFSLIQWAVIFLGMALVLFWVAYVTKNPIQVRTTTFTNPALWIERDELTVKVYPNKRVVERRYQLRALKKVDRYRFKFRWSGSENGKLALVGTDDTLIKVTGPTKVQWGWDRYEVRFTDALKSGNRKTVLLSYELPDDEHKAKPHHLVSYAHVVGCSKLVFRLSFPESDKARDVYLIHYDSDWVVQKGLPIGVDPDDNEHRVEIEPEAGIKYSLEWQEI